MLIFLNVNAIIMFLVFYLMKLHSFNPKLSTFSDNIASQERGLLSLNAKVENCNFVNNKLNAGSLSGIIFTEGSITVNNCSFVSNKCPYLFYNRNGVTLSVTNVKLFQNDISSSTTYGNVNPLQTTNDFEIILSHFSSYLCQAKNPLKNLINFENKPKSFLEDVPYFILHLFSSDIDKRIENNQYRKRPREFEIYQGLQFK